VRTSAARHLTKLATGIRGFDQLSRGGLPRNRTSLVMGGPGTGKTVFALQTLLGAARERKQPGIFVAFEEAPTEILANAAGFGWPQSAPARSAVFFLDARLSPEVVHSGEFELTGMLAVLEAKKKQLGAAWIVLDGIDVLLALLRDPGAEMREIYRVRDWLARNGLTAIVTAKLDGDSSRAINYGFMQFMVDCVIRFDRRLEQGIPVRRLEITKYRGSDFSAGEFPLSFGAHGMEVAAPALIDIPREASTERVSTGFAALDAMLGGGVFRGTTALLTGAPGTSKTTLAGEFAASACARGERTLFVSFDEGGERIRRNLTSVGIDLDPFVRSGLLRMYSGPTDASDPEEHLLRIATEILDHRPRCMVIDPLSAISRTGALSLARAAGNRLLCKIRDNDITAFITALVEGDDPQAEATDLRISTIADTWIHLSYLVRGGERNRALTIVKSRGTAHSNQVRELVLSAKGPALVDVYSAGGEVLMGTLRWEKEAEARARKLRQHAQYGRKRRELQLAEADTTARITALQADLDRQRAELDLYTREEEMGRASADEWQRELRGMRGASAPATGSAAPRKGGIARAAATPRGNGGREPRRGP
jgi:circadian clock protein KaiC